MATPAIDLRQVLTMLGGLPPEALAGINELARGVYAQRVWLPNPGDQQAVVESLADEIFAGGEPGGGKSTLLCGLSLTEHTSSILFRREFPQLKGLIDETARILKNPTRDGFSGKDSIWRIPGSDRTIEYGAVQYEESVEKYQGRAHDLKGFDEITHFSRFQYRYLTLWARSAKEGQRVRIIATGNPPRRPEGFWVIEHWAPWLHPKYHDPAEAGELRWPAWADEERDRELFFRTLEEAVAHLATIPDPQGKLRDPETGEILQPRSRTFLPLKLVGNLDLLRSGYASTLASAPKELQNLASGTFTESLPDDEDQLIPTAWIDAAMDRWTPEPPKDQPMSAIGVDVAQGGMDNTVLAPRYAHWYAPIIMVAGKNTPLPSDVASLIVKHRRDGAIPIIDCGGGYGGGVVNWLMLQSHIPCIAYKGGSAGQGRSECRTYGFLNKRAKSHWRFREALDPDRKGGAHLMLPPDPELKADLASVHYWITDKAEVQIEDKDAIKKRIMRSPDKGDAVIEAWDEGEIAVRRSVMGGVGLAAHGGPRDLFGRKLPSHSNTDRRPSRYDRHAQEREKGGGGWGSGGSGGEQG